ncbi:MAG: hypothetical protein ACQEVA_07430 [Myxococcota bacterium]
MGHRAPRYAVAVGLAATAFFLVSSCATLRPPIAFETEAPATPSPVRLDVVEGRPNGLLLELGMRDAPPGAVALQLLRAEAGTDAEIYREIQLEAQLREALHTDGIEFLDRNVAPDSTTRYQLRLVGEDDSTLAYSELVRVEWRPPPARPSELTGRATTPETVELRWKSAPGHGAIIFRRDVLQDHTKPERIGEVGPDSAGLFVDTDAEPGVVYAYRVSVALHAEDVKQLGPPSEPIYVDVPPH